jgi:hypothetical protein
MLCNSAACELLNWKATVPVWSTTDVERVADRMVNIPWADATPGSIIAAMDAMPTRAATLFSLYDMGLYTPYLPCFLL